MNAHFFQIFYFTGYDCFRQTEFRNAVYHNAAFFMKSLKYRNIMPGTADIGSNGKPRRTGTDNRNFFSRGLCNGRHRYKSVFTLIIGNETFQPSDRNGLFRRFQRFTKRTLPLTLFFLRADPSAYGREQVRLSDDIGCGLEFTFGDLCNKIRNLHVYRTAGHTWLIFALKAAVCFDNRLFLCVSQCNFRHFPGT